MNQEEKRLKGITDIKDLLDIEDGIYLWQGDITSEVRILGTESEQGVVLLMPSEKVKNGDRVF